MRELGSIIVGAFFIIHGDGVPANCFSKALAELCIPAKLEHEKTVILIQP